MPVFRFPKRLNPSAKGPGPGRVGRPQALGSSVEAIFGSPAMKAFLAVSGVDAITRVFDRDLEQQILFTSTKSRTAAQNAVIGLAHANQNVRGGGKGAAFLEAARRAAAIERGRDPGVSRGGRLPIRNPYYMSELLGERKRHRDTLRSALVEAVIQQDPAVFRAGFDRANQGQLDAYEAHFAAPRLLEKSNTFTGNVPLTKRYARWKLRQYGPKPILTASGQLRRSLRVVWTRGGP